MPNFHVNGLMASCLGIIYQIEKTTVAQRLPEDYAEQQSEFLSYVMYLRKENEYPLSLIGNMNEKEMIWWTENIWTKCSQQGSNPKSLLILDSFTAHKTDTVKKRFREKKQI